MKDKKFKIILIVFALAVFTAIIFTLGGCSKAKTESETAKIQPVSQVAPQDTTRPAPDLAFASTAAYDALEKENAKVKPSLTAYTVKPNLTNVTNRKSFDEFLDPKLTAMIVKNGFAVTPTNYIQMFQIYEENQYQSPKLPAFITTDSMLHIYHIFYDYTLRSIESNKLYDAAINLSKTMITASKQDVKGASTPELKDAALRNLAYFAVGLNLLNRSTPPSSVSKIAKSDLALISAHEGRTVSSITGLKIDFSQFVPRGHYTRSEKLKKYFRAMMWYGLTAFPIPDGKKMGPEHTLRALLMTHDLATAKGDPQKLWDTIYEPTAFYVGTADDYTFRQYSKIMTSIYGKDSKINDFTDKTKLDQFIAEVIKTLPAPGILNFVAVSRADHTPDPLAPVGRQFRFMGQRFIPDSRILQELTDPKVNGRNFPKGLDVFAAMGSDRALDIIEKTDNLKTVPGFTPQMDKMRKEMKETPQARWQSNLYYGWLWSLDSLIQPIPQGYPSFMQNPAWQDKSLFTGLGSWTELRHDTILYAKQSGAECGGGGEPDPVTRNYVEPNLEFWTRLKWLNKYTQDGLNSRGLIDEKLKDKFTKLDDWLEFCRRITIKELTDAKVTDDEYYQMDTYGADLEELMLDFAEGDLLSETDKDQALVADVHTSFDQCLEEGTGHAAAIYVVVPIKGKLYLTRGAVYTQYEFQWPSSDRLTDEAWQKILKSGKEPGFADWTKSFLIPTRKKKLPPDFDNNFGGC